MTYDNKYVTSTPENTTKREAMRNAARDAQVRSKNKTVGKSMKTKLYKKKDK